MAAQLFPGQYPPSLFTVAERDPQSHSSGNNNSKVRILLTATVFSKNFCNAYTNYMPILGMCVCLCVCVHMCGCIPVCTTSYKMSFEFGKLNL
jgi:hypothetical protein